MATNPAHQRNKPRFGIRAQIAFLSLGLISIPLLGVNYWNDARNSALVAQARIQQIEAKAIATTLLATQQNIRELLAGDEDSELQKYSLSAPPITQPIRLDGLFGDWPNPAVRRSSPIHSTRFTDPVWIADPDTPLESAFSLHLAQSPEHLYVGIEVQDNKVSFRQPNHLRLDYNDTIRLTFQNQDNKTTRIMIPAEREGALASYYTDEEWAFGRDQVQETGRIQPSHITGIKGYWRKTGNGYAVEFRMPTGMFYGLQPQIHFAIVDIDDQPALGPQAIVATLPEQFENQLNPVALHARELQRVIDQLKNTYARLWIFDRRGREWAFAERDPANRYTQQTFDSQCVQDALVGQVNPFGALGNYQSTPDRLVVCYPIQEGPDILGVVVIDESADLVLQKEEERIQTIGIKFGAALLLLLLILFVYAFTLVRRISRLSDETQRSIDRYGRIENASIRASQSFPDEIGDLSRSISSLLQKQLSYTEFLQRVPQTLRHEIANPLNKLRTSVENLIDCSPELERNPYLQKIDSGIDQITRITLHLTEAASLESAIQEETLQPLDFGAFLKGYLSTWEHQVSIEDVPTQALWIKGEPSRLEQLFDKLLENACSFCSDQGAVTVRVDMSSDKVIVLIDNDGPTLPSENPIELFSPMVSTRSSGRTIHLGLGLHIAKLISDHHGAVLKGENRASGNGVVFSVAFNRIEDPRL